MVRSVKPGSVLVLEDCFNITTFLVWCPWRGASISRGGSSVVGSDRRLKSAVLLEREMRTNWLMGVLGVRTEYLIQSYFWFIMYLRMAYLLGRCREG